MYPILIIQTPYTTVVYIQNQKYIEQSELLPLSWMKIGEIGARMGIQDYSIHVKKVYIMENEVNVGVDLIHFPDRYEHLPSEIINIVQGGVNEVKICEVGYVNVENVKVDEIMVKNRNNIKNTMKYWQNGIFRKEIRKYKYNKNR